MCFKHWLVLLPLDATTRAPYAPAAAVIAALQHWRRAPAERVDEALLRSAGVGRTVAPRTVQSLRLLDLIDPDGRPLEPLLELGGSDERDYWAWLSDWLRVGYGWVFELIGDPATASDQQITEAFRSNKPEGQQSRMAALFIGLCKEAGIIEGRPSRTLVAARASRRVSGGEGTPRGPMRVTPLQADDERRQAYVDLLMEKVRTSDGELDQELLARIEWLLGFRADPPDAAGRTQ